MANPEPETTTSTVDQTTAAVEPEVSDYLRGQEPAPEPEPNPAPEETEPVEDVATAADTEEHDTTGQELDPGDEEYSEKVKKRIGKAVAKQREAERQVEYWKEQAQRQLQPLEQGTQTEALEAPPKEDDFDNYDEYISAKAEYSARQAVRNELRAAEQIRVAQARRAHVEGKLAEGARRLAEQGVNDFDRVFTPAEKGGPLVTNVMFEACNESPLTAEIAYYLATHVDEARQIAGQSPIGQVRAIGKIEHGLETGALRLMAPSTTKAPPPIPHRVGGKQPAGVNVDPDKMDIKEWMKRDREGTLKYKRL